MSLEEIQALLEKRSALRKEKQFAEADAIRKQLEDQGVSVQDTPSDSTIVTPKSSPRLGQFLLLFGSGATSAVGQTAHEYVFSQLGIDTIKIAIISTPAGFQPNVKVVYEEVAEFYEKRLGNYHPQISIIYANTKEDCNNPELLTAIETADVIATGPGSPSYGLKTLHNTLLYEKIKTALKNGVSLSLNSAATLMFSRYTLPIYEIYKVGEPLHWLDGLDLYKNLFEDISIVPHFNNNEGGEKTDTSCCYIGRDRYQKLLKLLPAGQKIWGIDEHTCVIVNLATKEIKTLGRGKSHELITA